MPSWTSFSCRTLPGSTSERRSSPCWDNPKSSAAFSSDAIVRLRAGRRDWWLPLLLLVVVAVEFVLKATIPQAPPPHELARNVQLLPFLESPTPFSFPSGHLARIAFLVSSLRWPGSLSAVIVLAMAVTRIYLGEHWPTDVLGGWLLGYGIAALAYRSK